MELHASVLDALPHRIAVVDGAGRIVLVNAAWRAVTAAAGIDPRLTCEGADYLAVCDRASGEAAVQGRRVGEAIRDILAGRRDAFAMDYPCNDPLTGEAAWFEVRADALERDGRRFVGLEHLDRTRSKRAEHERTRSRRVAARLHRLARAFREAEGRLRRAEDAAGVVAIEMDLDDAPPAAATQGSPAAALRALLGLPRGAPPGRPDLLAAAHPEDRELLHAALDRVAEGGSLREEFRLAASCPTRWIQIRGTVAAPLPSGAAATGWRPRFLGALLDVTERRAAEEALRASERRHRALAEAGALITWRADPAGAVVASRGWEALTGRPESSMRGDDPWLAAIHPEDRARAARAWAESRARAAPLDTEVRVETRAGGWHWLRVRAVPVRTERGGALLEWAGVLEDVDARRRAEERRELLAREVDHRARNVLAVVQAVVRLGRASAGDQAMAAAVEDRIAALARAHAILTESGWAGADLRTLIAGELAPYHTAAGPRVVLEGPAVTLSTAAAQALSLAVHELATNATKHGALSRFEGVLAVAWWFEGRDTAALALRWSERGGPPLRATPSRQGFGSRILRATIAHQLGGRLALRWEAEGLVVEMRLPRERVLAGRPAEARDQPAVAGSTGSPGGASAMSETTRQTPPERTSEGRKRLL